MKPVRHLSVLVILAAVGLAACQSEPAPTPTPTATSGGPISQDVAATDTDTPTPTDVPTATPLPIYGPDDYPENVNPLTGLEVDDTSVLERPPILVKVSNQSNQVRPQSGLSYADHVWMYQMEGWAQTRFTAVYYSQAPEFIGSVRSVRLIDTDYLLHMYDALLVLSGGSVGMATIIKYADWNARAFLDNGPHLERIPNIPYEGMTGYHSLFARPEIVWEEAKARGVYNTDPALNGMAFSEAVPEDGTETAQVTIDYPGKGPAIRWEYDDATGTWKSWQQMQLGEPEDFTPDTDYLTSKQLAWENVVIVYADYYLADFIEDEPNQLLSIGPVLEGEGSAVLLRDGMRYDVTWQHAEGESMLHLLDADGNSVPFKPGQTWWNVISYREDQYPPEVTFK